MKTLLQKSVMAATLIATLMSGSVAFADTATRELTIPNPQAPAVAQDKTGGLAVITLIDRADATYAVGETVRLAVKANQDAYLTVFDIGPTGKVTQLFPNAYQTSNAVKAGEAIEIPAPQSGAAIQVSAPVGKETIKVIATSQPVTIVPEEHYAAGNGLFRSLAIGADQLERDLVETTAKLPPDLHYAIEDQTIQTVEKREAPVLTVATAPEPVDSFFPLLLASDKGSYRVGDKLYLAVTPLQPCYLTVFEQDAHDRVHVLYPTAQAAGNPIAAGRTVMISGGDAPQTLTAANAGSETIRAVCTSELHQFVAVKGSTIDPLSADEQEAVKKELEVVAAKPTNAIGIAEIKITVAP
jgi:hypothetical protein